MKKKNKMNLRWFEIKMFKKRKVYSDKVKRGSRLS